ncbi:MAG TPA: aminotransferase class I/II [Porticoccaceae bacterium]|nr:aminotransferase class I/II [Porticoccaceae bacterium]
MKVPLTSSIAGLNESATLAINIRAREIRAQGGSVCHFGFGQSPFPVPLSIQNALRDHAAVKDYLPTLGLPELREAVARFYQQEMNSPFSAEHVCIGPGSKELIFQALFLLEAAVLIPAPSWVSYGPQAQLLGKPVYTLPTRREHHYRLQADVLEQICQQLDDTPKLLIINSPNNPTGAVYGEDDLSALAEVCRKFGIIVLSDEIYAMIDFTGQSHQSMAHAYPEGTIVTGGLSKSFAAGGYRLGVMLIPDPLRALTKALQTVASETFSTVSAPVQYAALEAYGHFDTVRSFINQTVEIHRSVAEYVHTRFIGMGLNCPEPQGAFYMMPDFQNYRASLAKKGITSDEALCHALLGEAHIALLPGSSFYLGPEALSARVAFVDYDGSDVLARWPGKDALTAENMADLFPHITTGCDRLEQYFSLL